MAVVEPGRVVVISRLVALDHWAPLEPGMVFALENYGLASDGWSAARIEAEILVTRYPFPGSVRLHRRPRSDNPVRVPRGGGDAESPP